MAGQVDHRLTKDCFGRGAKGDLNSLVAWLLTGVLRPRPASATGSLGQKQGSKLRSGLHQEVAAFPKPLLRPSCSGKLVSYLMAIVPGAQLQW